MGIVFNNAGMFYGEKVLFRNVNLQLDYKNRYGITGANGTGKSTLLKVMAGKEILAYGSMEMSSHPSLGFLDQDLYMNENNKILDTVIQGNKKLWDALKKRDELNTGEGFNKEILSVEETIEKEDGYKAHKTTARILEGLGIHNEFHEKPLGILSGGYRFRVFLAKILFSKPDILILDEPTNHLDINSIEWLQNYITKEFRGTVIIISHNRDFLNNTVTHILDIDYQTITVFKGDYDHFEKEKKIQYEIKEKSIKNEQKRANEMQEFIDRFRAKSSKARQAQSKLKQLDKMEIPDIVQSSRKFPHITFPVQTKSGTDVLKIKNISKSFDNRQIFDGLSLSIQRGDRISIIGPNGSGKSTLLKILVNMIEPDSGSIHWNQNSSFSFLDQDIYKELDENAGLFSYFHTLFPSENTKNIRSHLASYLFFENDINKKIKVLSGGEITRLLLSIISYQKKNVLVLDEPTNHLDLESTISLEKALIEYSGTLIMVSHDTRIIRKTSTRILYLRSENKNPIDYEGSYDDFIEKYSEEVFENIPSAIRSNKKGKNNYIAKKEKEKNIRKIKNDLSQKKRDIIDSENQINDINKQFSEPETYNQLSMDEISALQKTKDSLEQKNMALLEEIDQLEKELSSLLDL